MAPPRCARDASVTKALQGKGEEGWEETRKPRDGNGPIRPLGSQTRGKQNPARRFATKQDGLTAKPAQMPIVPQGKHAGGGKGGGREFRV